MKFEGFPFILTHKNEQRVCHFQCKEHVDKYIEQHKLKKKDYELQQPKVRKPRKKVSGSTGNPKRSVHDNKTDHKRSGRNNEGRNNNKRRSTRSKKKIE